MKAILYALKSPEGWMGAIFLAAVLIVPSALHRLIDNKDDKDDSALSAAERMTQFQVGECLAERGQGAAVLYDADGNYKDCKQRRKS